MACTLTTRELLKHRLRGRCPDGTLVVVTCPTRARLPNDAWIVLLHREQDPDLRALAGLYVFALVDTDRQSETEIVEWADRLCRYKPEYLELVDTATGRFLTVRAGHETWIREVPPDWDVQPRRLTSLEEGTAACA